MTTVGVRSSGSAAGVRRGARVARHVAFWETARIAVTVALITGVTGLVVTVGADTRWLGALGRALAAGHSATARGVPFAAATTAHWANPLVLAELVFHLLVTAAGTRGLAVAQLACVAAGLSIVAADARAGRARSSSIALVLGLAAVGAFPSLAIARVQMFSLLLFPALVALLRAEARRPSRRIWLVLPLLTLWGNLHGAALSGLVVLFVYLGLERGRKDPRLALVLAVAAPIALCITPAGIGTISYYHGLVTNLAAQRGVGQWAPLGSTLFDWAAIAAAAALAAMIARGWRRHRPLLWELVLIAILAALTVKAGRDAIWLLFAMAAPAARAIGRAPAVSSAGSRPASPRGRTWNGLVPLGAILAILLLAAGVSAHRHEPGASAASVTQTIRLAAGTPILADAIPAEQVALAGGRIWAGDPLDAFSRTTQAAYLDWIDGSGAAALLANPRIRVVLATRGSAAAALTAAAPGFSAVGGDATAIVFERRPRHPERHQ